MGDSAFGFSAMELETVCRYNLPMIVFIINNNGIFTGVEELTSEKNRGTYFILNYQNPLNLPRLRLNQIQGMKKWQKRLEELGYL